MIIVCFSDLQAPGDLLRCILLVVINTRNMDWNIEKRCITRLLFVLNGLHIFDVNFKWMLCPNDAQGFFEFLYMKCFVIVYIEYKSGVNDLKATGDVATFT